MPEGARLPIAEEPATAVLPEASPHWVYVLENVFPHLIVGKVWIVDGDTGNVLGMVNTGYTPNMAIANDKSEFYVTEIYWSRGTRGERSGASVRPAWCITAPAPC